MWLQILNWLEKQTVPNVVWEFVLHEKKHFATFYHTPMKVPCDELFISFTENVSKQNTALYMNNINNHQIDLNANTYNIINLIRKISCQKWRKSNFYMTSKDNSRVQALWKGVKLSAASPLWLSWICCG